MTPSSECWFIGPTISGILRTVIVYLSILHTFIIYVYSYTTWKQTWLAIPTFANSSKGSAEPSKIKDPMWRTFIFPVVLYVAPDACFVLIQDKADRNEDAAR